MHVEFAVAPAHQCGGLVVVELACRRHGTFFRMLRVVLRLLRRQHELILDGNVEQSLRLGFVRIAVRFLLHDVLTEHFGFHQVGQNDLLGAFLLLRLSQDRPVLYGLRELELGLHSVAVSLAHGGQALHCLHVTFFQTVFLSRQLHQSRVTLQKVHGAFGKVALVVKVAADILIALHGILSDGRDAAGDGFRERFHIALLILIQCVEHVEPGRIDRSSQILSVISAEVTLHQVRRHHCRTGIRDDLLRSFLIITEAYDRFDSGRIVFRGQLIARKRVLRHQREGVDQAAVFVLRKRLAADGIILDLLIDLLQFVEIGFPVKVVRCQRIIAAFFFGVFLDLFIICRIMVVLRMVDRLRCRMVTVHLLADVFVGDISVESRDHTVEFLFIRLILYSCFRCADLSHLSLHSLIRPRSADGIEGLLQRFPLPVDLAVALPVAADKVVDRAGKPVGSAVNVVHVIGSPCLGDLIRFDGLADKQFRPERVDARADLDGILAAGRVGEKVAELGLVPEIRAADGDACFGQIDLLLHTLLVLLHDEHARDTVLHRRPAVLIQLDPEMVQHLEVCVQECEFRFADRIRGNEHVRVDRVAFITLSRLFIQIFRIVRHIFVSCHFYCFRAAREYPRCRFHHKQAGRNFQHFCRRSIKTA